MLKKDILKKLREINLDKDKYLVISGAAMVLLGIKEETQDIDIAVSKEYYNYLLKNYKCHFDRVNEYAHKCYNIDIINFGMDYYSNNYEIVEGIKVQKVEDIINLKKIFK